METKQDFFKSSKHSEPRELTEEDIEKLNKQDVATEFKQKKLELEARKNWDCFYKRNKDNFFKDRNWSAEDMKELCPDFDFSTGLVYLEAGVGVGNMLFPLATAFPSLRLQGFDFSKNAVEMLKKRAEELQIQVESDVIDLTDSEIVNPFSGQADLASLIFVLSAIHPEKQLQAIQHLKRFVKIGGSVVIRDYGDGDYAMLRFGRGAKLSERFYARQDGTRAYFFKKEELIDLFEQSDFRTERIEYLQRRTVNYEKSLDVPRSFVQARFIRVK